MKKANDNLFKFKNKQVLDEVLDYYEYTVEIGCDFLKVMTDIFQNSSDTFANYTLMDMTLENIMITSIDEFQDDLAFTVELIESNKENKEKSKTKMCDVYFQDVLNDIPIKEVLVASKVFNNQVLYGRYEVEDDKVRLVSKTLTNQNDKSKLTKLYTKQGKTKLTFKHDNLVSYVFKYRFKNEFLKADIAITFSKDTANNYEEDSIEKNFNSYLHLLNIQSKSSSIVLYKTLKEIVCLIATFYNLKYKIELKCQLKDTNYQEAIIDNNNNLEIQVNNQKEKRKVLK